MTEHTCEFIENISNLILAIMSDEDTDPLWRRFYRIQMASFILSRRGFSFETCDAKAAYTVIREGWSHLNEILKDYPIRIRNLDAIFTQVMLDFPCGDNTLRKEELEQVKYC